MADTIKITSLVPIGSNVPGSTVVPVVDMTSTPTTKKATVANIANSILAQAGNLYASAHHALAANSASLAVHVAASSQPNITSTGVLTSLAVSGNSGLSAEATLINQDPAGSSKWVSYGAGGSSAGGSVGIGFTGSTFSDSGYSITRQGDGYVFVQGYANGTGGGNLVFATGNQGTTKDIVFATGGFEASREFARISHANNTLELTRADASIKFSDGTVIGAVEGANTFGFYSNNANTAFLLEAASNVWTFDGASSTVTLPNDSVLVAQNTQTYLSKRTTTTASDAGVGNDSAFIAMSSLTVGDDRRVATEASLDNLIVSVTDTGGTSQVWEFDNTGNLTVPGNVISTVPTGLTLGSNYDVFIVADRTDNNRTWKFDGSAGELILPNNGIIDPSDNNFEVRGIENVNFEANASINLYTDASNNSFQWQFSDDGNLTVPGNIISSLSASPAPILSGFGFNGSEVVASGNVKVSTLNGNLVLGRATATGSPGLSSTSSITFTSNREGTTNEMVFGTTGDLSLSGNISTSGNISSGNLSVTGNISGNTNGYTIGYLNVPQVSASDTTLALSDAGKHYYSTSTGNFTLTVPNNATTSFNTGTAISIVMQGTGNILVNAASGVTLYMAGNSTAANRVVGGYGMATLMKVASDTWFINGTGVS